MAPLSESERERGGGGGEGERERVVDRSIPTPNICTMVISFPLLFFTENSLAMPTARIYMILARWPD